MAALARWAVTAAGLGLAWGLFEAQWVETREQDVPVSDLPEPLDGFRILHLSDFHLGTPSLNGLALEKAVRFAERLEPDLVAITGDLLTHPRGEPRLRAALRRLHARHGVAAVLGNHDIAVTRDPFSAASELEDLEASGARLLRDAAFSFEHEGCTVRVAGLDPRSVLARRVRLGRLAAGEADLRILLCHYPDAAWWVPPRSFGLVLAGHLHGGQICVPTPWGKVGLAHPRPRMLGGVRRVRDTTLVVSRGLGTTFVPVRMLARPEASLLVLRHAAAR